MAGEAASLRVTAVFALGLHDLSIFVGPDSVLTAGSVEGEDGVAAAGGGGRLAEAVDLIEDHVVDGTIEGGVLHVVVGQVSYDGTTTGFGANAVGVPAFVIDNNGSDSALVACSKNFSAYVAGFESVVKVKLSTSSRIFVKYAIAFCAGSLLFDIIPADFGRSCGCEKEYGEEASDDGSSVKTSHFDSNR